MLTPDEITAIILSLKLAAITSCILLLLGLPTAWWLAQTKSKSKVFFEALFSLPLVLPPSVLGFYLLILLGKQSPFAGIFSSLGIDSLAFSFSGLVIGSIIYSLPFVIQPLQNGFSSLDSSYLEQSRCFGYSNFQSIFKLIIPLCKNSLLTAWVLAFAHTLGEFGVVLMIGGNISGETKVISIAIYESVESLDYASAHRLSLLLLGFSFVVLFCIALSRQRVRVFGL